MNEPLYLVFEGGGDAYDPRFHGLFGNLGHAKERVKRELLEFIKKLMLPEHTLETMPIQVDKQISDRYTYFYVYADEEEQEIGSYANVFVIYTIQE